MSGEFWSCPSCGLHLEGKHDECPRCGIIVAKFQKRQTQAVSAPSRPIPPPNGAPLDNRDISERVLQRAKTKTDSESRLQPKDSKFRVNFLVVVLFCLIIVLGTVFVGRLLAPDNLEPKRSSSSVSSQNENRPVATPSPNIREYCRRVSEVSGGSYQIMETCMEMENRAKANLDQMSIPPQIERYCRDVGNAVGGSYQIMETCVKQELDSKNRLE